MIKPRDPATFAGTIATIVERVGHRVVAAEIETSTSELYRWSDEESPKLPRLDVAVRLDRLAARHGLGTPILDAFAGKLDSAVRPVHQVRDPLDAVTSAMHETAEAISAYRAAVQRATPSARAAALREIDEALRELALLRADLTAGDGA